MAENFLELTIENLEEDAIHPTEVEMCSIKIEANEFEDYRNSKCEAQTVEKPRDSGICENKCSQKDELAKDELRRIVEKPYKCGVCNRAFSDKSNCNKHVRIHTKNKPFKCLYCSQIFPSKDELIKHKTDHQGEKRYKCQYCDRAFDKPFSIKEHERVHTGEKPYKCTFCEMSFRQKIVLKQHARRHTGEKPFKCKVCEKCFPTQSNLITHERRYHSEEKPYKCTLCDKSFYRRYALTHHQKIHTEERDFQCSLCGQLFLQKAGLAYHERIVHSNEKPYKCKTCDNTYKVKRYLIKHENSGLCDLSKANEEIKSDPCDFSDNQDPDQHSDSDSIKIEPKISINCSLGTNVETIDNPVEKSKDFLEPIDNNFLKLEPLVVLENSENYSDTRSSNDETPLITEVREESIVLEKSPTIKKKWKDKRPFKCSFCEKSFRDKCNLLNKFQGFEIN